MTRMSVEKTWAWYLSWSAQGAGTARSAPAGFRRRQVFAKQVPQTGRDALSLGGVHRSLPVAVHAFVASAQALLKTLVSKVGRRHRIADGIEQVPSNLRGQQQATLPCLAPKVIRQPAAGGNEVQDGFKLVGWAEGVGIGQPHLGGLLCATVAAGEGFFVIAPAGE